MKSFKVIVFTPIWGRHEIVKLWAEGVERLRDYYPERIEIEPFCIVSNKEDENFIKDLGYRYTWAENKPLGAKHNAGIQALRHDDWDYILQLGSDDLASSEYLLYAIKAMDRGLDLFGVHKLYFVDNDSKEARKFTLTTQPNMLIGAGRFISYKAIEKLNFDLWPNDVNRGLDFTSQLNLQSVGVAQVTINTEAVCICDVKSGVNIWPFERFESYPSVTITEVRNIFPEI